MRSVICWKIRASQNGTAAAVRHYQSKYASLNESIVRGFKSCVEKELEIATKKKIDPREKLSIQPQGIPLMLGDEIDEKVQLYIQQLSQREGVISRSIAVSVATVLLGRDESLGKKKVTET